MEPIARIRYRMKLVTGTICCQRMCLISDVDWEIEKLKRSGLEVIDNSTKGNGRDNRATETDIVT